MLATFAFDVCHDVYLAAREAIGSKIPTMNAESSGKYEWRPDRMPRLAEYVCDFARAGEKVLGSGTDAHAAKDRVGAASCLSSPLLLGEPFRGRRTPVRVTPGKKFCPTGTPRATRLAMFHVYYLGGAEYAAARRHLGISEFTWADWAEEIRRDVGRELMRGGLFPPSKYFQEMTKRAS